MIKIDVYNGENADVFIRRIEDNPSVTAAVADILANVRARADVAGRGYSAKFDGYDGAFAVRESEWAGGG